MQKKKNILYHILIVYITDRAVINYSSGIPAVSETANGRKLETARLREMRKRLDSGNCSQDEIEAMGLECLPDVVELCSGMYNHMYYHRVIQHNLLNLITTFCRSYW